MNGFKKYIVTWTEEHSMSILATSEDHALTDAMIRAGGSITCIKSKDFKV